MLLNRHGDRVLRVKGHPERRRCRHPGRHSRRAAPGPSAHPHVGLGRTTIASSRLVFIVDGLDRGLIERSLGAFLGATASYSAAGWSKEVLQDRLTRKTSKAGT
jgi:hypothetical protein